MSQIQLNISQSRGYEAYQLTQSRQYRHLFVKLKLTLKSRYQEIDKQMCIRDRRYIHSHTSMIHRDDYENTVKLMTEVVRRLDQETVNKITFE